MWQTADLQIYYACACVYILFCVRMSDLCSAQLVELLLSQTCCSCVWIVGTIMDCFIYYILFFLLSLWWRQFESSWPERRLGCLSPCTLYLPVCLCVLLVHLSAGSVCAGGERLSWGWEDHRQRVSDLTEIRGRVSQNTRAPVERGNGCRAVPDPGSEFRRREEMRHD